MPAPAAPRSWSPPGIVRDRAARPGAPGRGRRCARRRARERLDRERSDLVATVAHELRSPLTGVKGFTATLLAKWDRLNDDQKQLMLETVNADADRLTRLITELLDVARIDTGRLPLYPRPVDIAAAGRRGCVAARSGPAPTATIEFDVDGDLPQIWADPDKLDQVVANLVENASGTARARSRSTVDADRRSGVRRACCSASTTRARGSPDEIRQPGLHQVLEARRRAAAPAWACTSSTAWSRPTAARSSIDDAPGGGARFRSLLAGVADAAPEPVPREPALELRSRPPPARAFLD